MEHICQPSEVSRMVREFYNMEIIGRTYLDGYEDLNILLQVRLLCNNEARDVVLKLSPFTDKKVVSSVDLQAQIMEYLTTNGILVPGIVRTVNNEPYFTSESKQGINLCGRMLTFIEGTTLRKVDGCLPLGDIGRAVGKMDAVLKYVNINTEWGLSNALLLRDMLPRYCPREAQEMGEEILNDFETRLLPVMDRFQKGFIHSDITGTNICAIKHPEHPEVDNNGRWTISGIIDFGDACLGTYVYEIAILLADIMAHSTGSVIKDGKYLLDGFRSEFDLNHTERSCLRLCICVRLLQCFILTEKAAMASPWNRAYIARSRDLYIACCEWLWDLGESKFRRDVFGTTLYLADH